MVFSIYWVIDSANDSFGAGSAVLAATTGTGAGVATTMGVASATGGADGDGATGAAGTSAGTGLDLFTIANEDATAAATSGEVVVAGTGTVPVATISLVEIASPPKRCFLGSALTTVANADGAAVLFFILSLSSFFGVLGADSDSDPYSTLTSDDISPRELALLSKSLEDFIKSSALLS